MTIGPIAGHSGRVQPRIVVALDDVVRYGASWRVRWRVRNDGPRAVTVVQAWHPHRRFRSSRVVRSLRIPAGRSAVLAVPARSDVRAGEVMENGFLILRVIADRSTWRVLVRATVRGDDHGTPRPRVKAVDVHPAER